MSSTSPPIQEWLARYAVEGDEAAFAAVVRAQSPLVWRTAMRRLGDAQLAEEAVQNVFLALARKAERLAARPGLSAWLHRAAVLEASALARSRARRERRHRLLGQRLENEGGTEPEVAWWSMASVTAVKDIKDVRAGADGSWFGKGESGKSRKRAATAMGSGSSLSSTSLTPVFPSPPAANFSPALVDSAVGLLLDEALSRLPELDRAVLLGRYFEERSYEDLGGALGKTGAAVKKRAQRALEKIAAHLRRRGVVLSAGAAASLAATDFSRAALGNPVPIAAAWKSGGGCTVSSASASSASATASGAATWIQRLIFFMNTSKATITAAALLLLLLGVSGWQSAANATLRQEILSRRTVLDRKAESAARAKASGAAAAARPPARPAEPLPDPVDGMTLVRLYAYSRAGEALLVEPPPPNWPKDMEAFYQRASTADILRLISEASNASVAQSLRLKVMRDLITTRLPDHDPALAVRMAAGNGVTGQDLTRLMRKFAEKDLAAAESVLGEFGAPGSRHQAANLIAGFSEHFVATADPSSWREIPPALLAFADRHLDSGLISALILGGDDNPQGSPIVNALTFNPGPALDLAGRVTDEPDRNRIFTGLAQFYLMMLPNRIAPNEGGSFVENGELRIPINPDPEHPERYFAVVPNVLEDPRFPAELRDSVLQTGAGWAAAMGNVWAALDKVRQLSSPGSRAENLAKTAEKLASIPIRRAEMEKLPDPSGAEGRLILDQTLADTAQALAARQNPDLARTLAEKISDPLLRSRVLRSATP